MIFVYIMIFIIKTKFTMHYNSVSCELPLLGGRGVLDFSDLTYHVNYCFFAMMLNRRKQF
jgi:hypothetical protein